MRPVMEAYRDERSPLPTVAFGDRPAAEPTLEGDVPRKAPGKVEDQASDPKNGVFSAKVDARRPAVALLKSSFDPRWRVTVDGRRVEPQLIAPAFVGAPIDDGEHTVRFEYVPLRYGGLFALSVLALAALVVIPWLVRTRRRRSAG